MNGIALIHPPGTDPRGPRLAVPSLSAFLRRNGVPCRAYDLDLSSLLALLTPESLAGAGMAVRRKYRNDPRTAEADLARLAALSEQLPATVPRALSILRGSSFFNPLELTPAREILLDGLDLVSAASERGICYSVDPPCYEVAGASAARFDDLLKATADRSANLFATYWDESFIPELEEHDWDCIGISIGLRFQLLPGLMLARQLRARGHFVVLGGSLLQRFTQRLMDLPEFFNVFADGVVTGDGETAIAEIVEQVSNHRNFSSVPNFLYPDGNRIRFTRAHIEDLATLPTPDFSDLPLDSYLVPAPVLPLMVGRGCYYSACKFCEIPHNQRVSGHPYRHRPPEMIVDDLIKLSDRHSCRHFLIGDEAVHPVVLERIADALNESRRNDLRFAAYLRPEPGFTAGLCRKLAASGLRRVYVGIESGSQRMLNHMRKGIQAGAVRTVLENFHAAEIGIVAFAMLGLPEETASDARQTYEFFDQNADLFDHPGNSFQIQPMSLQVCTPYMDEAAALGLQFSPAALAGDFVCGIGKQWENTRGLSRSATNDLLREYATLLQSRYHRFHSWPPVLWPVWEEWALLYADHYAEREFPFRVALPETDASLVSFRWNPALLINGDDRTVTLSSRLGTAVLPRRTYRGLEQTGRVRPDQLVLLLAGAGGAPDDAGRTFRDAITGLVRAGLLQIVPAAEDGETISSPKP